MTLTEKAAHLKGLAEGLSLDEKKAETKLINAMIALLDDMTLTVSDLEDSVAVLGEQVDAVDEDLEELESFVYDDYDDEDEDEDYYDVQCPSCGETICVDTAILEAGSIHCPSCDELLEFEIECDCGCADEDDEE